MSGCCSASSVQELAGYSEVWPGSIQCINPCSKAEIHFAPLTSAGREAVQEGSAELPVAVVNMRTADAASTAVYILCPIVDSLTSTQKQTEVQTCCWSYVGMHVTVKTS